MFAIYRWALSFLWKQIAIFMPHVYAVKRHRIKHGLHFLLSFFFEQQNIWFPFPRQIRYKRSSCALLFPLRCQMLWEVFTINLLERVEKERKKLFEILFRLRAGDLIITNLTDNIRKYGRWMEKWRFGRKIWSIQTLEGSFVGVIVNSKLEMDVYKICLQVDLNSLVRNLC